MNVLFLGFVRGALEGAGNFRFLLKLNSLFYAKNWISPKSLTKEPKSLHRSSQKIYCKSNSYHESKQISFCSTIVFCKKVSAWSLFSLTYLVKTWRHSIQWTIIPPTCPDLSETPFWRNFEVALTKPFQTFKCSAGFYVE